MKVDIAADWHQLLSSEFEQDYFVDLVKFVKSEYLEGKQVYPLPAQIFNAFSSCALESTKVVILGQDPYHGMGQAMGLSFSVPEGEKIPPSLRNIYKEISADLGEGSPVHNTGDLTGWAEQGVLLLNSTLTVLAGQPGSHQAKGWETFTDSVIAKLAQEKAGIVFMLWGAYARKKIELIDRDKNLVLEAPHPSPFSAHKGFFGSGHFSKANAYLRQNGVAEIVW